MLWVHFEILCLRQIKKTFETKRPRLAEVFSPSFLKRTLNISRTLSLWCCGLVSGYHEFNRRVERTDSSDVRITFTKGLDGSAGISVISTIFDYFSAIS